MASVTVLHGREIIQKLQLSKDHILIGRHDMADIILNNVMVSRKQAMLVRHGGIWVLEDISGKDTVFVNGRIIRRQALKNGDTVEIGKFMIRFEQTKDELERDHARAQKQPGAEFKLSFGEMMAEASGTPEQETFQKVQAQVDTTESTMRLAPEQLESLRKGLGQRRGAHLSAVTPMPKSTYPLDKGMVLIGRSDSADIPIKGGLTIGKTHAKMSCFGGKWFVEKVDGLGSLKVNGNKVSQHQLKEGDELEIGSTKLQFHDAVKEL